VDLVSALHAHATWTTTSTWASITLGSCTMKYNPKLNERVARIPQIAATHPLFRRNWPRYLEIMFRWQETPQGSDRHGRLTLQPAGVAGRVTGILMVRAYHKAQGNPRRYVLIPDSAHGTNPAQRNDSWIRGTEPFRRIRPGRSTLDP